MEDSRRLSPDYAFRVTFEEIKATYQTAEAAFARGDFMVAAQLAEPDSEVHACSLVLSGLSERGLATLERKGFRTERAQLCRTFALWSLNRAADAKAFLQGSDLLDTSKKLRTFRALLDRDDITVFITGAMLPIFRDQHQTSALAPTWKYGPFTAKYVASQMPQNAYDYHPDQAFDGFIDGLPQNERPDFIFALSPQWVVPRNFERVRVPKVIWCHDTDMFLYRNAENFALYDVGISGCSQEHFELTHGSGLYAAANLLSNPLNMPFPLAHVSETKNVDVLFTGAALSSFHSEKPRFLFQLAELAEDYVIRVIDGHLPEAKYFGLLASSRILPIIGRHAGVPSPRWRDALTNGACIAFPEGTFYDEVATGCLPFRSGSIVSDIRRHLDHLREHESAEMPATVAEVNKRFAVYRQPREKLFEMQLMYAAFLALIWRDGQAPQKPKPEARRRVWLTPGVDCAIYDRDTIRERMARYADASEADDLRDLEGCAGAAHLHAQLAVTFPEDEQLPVWAARASQHYATAIGRYPRSLLLRFNQAHWELFDPTRRFDERTGEKFDAIITAFDALQFDPAGADVGMAYTLHDRDLVFPYYEYADAVTSELINRDPAAAGAHKVLKYSPRVIILSACYGYIGWSLMQRRKWQQALSYFERATAIFPPGLPLQRLYLEALIVCAANQQDVPALGKKIADVSFAVANLDPVVLLTRCVAIIPLLAEAGETSAARDLLAGWYRLGNIIYAETIERNRYLSIEMSTLLYHYRELLPQRLIKRIESADIGELTQLERTMLDASKLYRRDDVLKRLQAKEHLSAKFVDPAYRIGIGAGAFSFAALWTASRLWWKLPRSVKLQYGRKSWFWIRRVGLRATLLRIQHWSTDSAWARELQLSLRQ